MFYFSRKLIGSQPINDVTIGKCVTLTILILTGVFYKDLILLESIDVNVDLAKFYCPMYLGLNKFPGTPKKKKPKKKKPNKWYLYTTNISVNDTSANALLNQTKLKIKP